MKEGVNRSSPAKQLESYREQPFCCSSCYYQMKAKSYGQKNECRGGANGAVALLLRRAQPDEWMACGFFALSHIAESAAD